jgi:hypothetical protein
MQPWITGSVFSNYLDHAGCVNPQKRMPGVRGSTMTFDGHGEIPNLKSLVAQAIGSLNMLSSCSKDTPDLSALVRHLRDTCRIVHERSSDWLIEKQFRLVHPFAAWMDKYTISYFAISEKDTVVLATLAHFYAVVVCLALAFPEMALPLTTTIRLKSIIEIGQVFGSKPPFFCRGCREVHYQEGMMAFPLNAVHMFQECEDVI